MTDSSRGVAVLTKLKRKAYGAAFDWVLKNKIIYTYLNEDPEVDKQFLNINDQTRLLTITGSGDKALEYLVEGPGAVRSVDLNYRQNALLDLKLAAFRTCEYDDIWQLFVQGYHADYRAVYTKLRPLLREPSRKFWDAKHSYFKKGMFRRSIYHHGSAGFHLWLSGFAARKRFREIFGADDPDTARQLYDGKIRRMLSNRFVNAVNNRWIGHVLHGLPYPQAAQVKEGHHLDLADRVFRGTTVSENYFWHCYCLGYFKDDCCPKYLQRENFEKMRDWIDRLDFQTVSLAGYLQQSDEKFTAFRPPRPPGLAHRQPRSPRRRVDLDPQPQRARGQGHHPVPARTRRLHPAVRPRAAHPPRGTGRLTDPTRTILLVQVTRAGRSEVEPRWGEVSDELAPNPGKS